MFSESAAPGDKPKFLGVREQRLTHIIIFEFCGLPIFFTPILQRIPMPVLYGVFLYMGISSLNSSQERKTPQTTAESSPATATTAEDQRSEARQ